MTAPAILEVGVRAYLLAQSGFSAMVEGRVYAAEMPDAESRNQPRRALLIRASGGASLTGQSTMEHDARRIDVFAYGPTPLAAANVMAMADLLLRRLKRGVYDDVLIHCVNSAGGAAQDREPGTEWPRHFQSFQALYALNQVQS